MFEMKFPIKFSSLLFVLSQLSVSASAQEVNDYASIFSGQWVTFSSAYTGDGVCSLEFSKETVDEIHPVSIKNCRGELDNVAGWTVQQSQIVLVSSSSEVLATLGGNQFRLSGETTVAKVPFVIERQPQAMEAFEQRKSIECSYIGYSKDCAKPQQFAPPFIEAGKTSPVKILVNLNARSEPRPSAKVVEVIGKNTCVQVNACTISSDGLWCRAQMSEDISWFKKQAVRQGKWPIISFVSGC